jgi:hypothetical protein
LIKREKLDILRKKQSEKSESASVTTIPHKTTIPVPVPQIIPTIVEKAQPLSSSSCNEAPQTSLLSAIDIEIDTAAPKEVVVQINDNTCVTIPIDKVKNRLYFTTTNLCRCDNSKCTKIHIELEFLREVEQNLSKYRTKFMSKQENTKELELWYLLRDEKLRHKRKLEIMEKKKLKQGSSASSNVLVPNTTSTFTSVQQVISPPPETTFQSSDRVLPQFQSSDRVLPQFQSSDRVLPQFQSSDRVLPQSLNQSPLSRPFMTHITSRQPDFVVLKHKDKNRWVKIPFYDILNGSSFQYLELCLEPHELIECPKIHIASLGWHDNLAEANQEEVYQNHEHVKQYIIERNKNQPKNLIEHRTVPKEAASTLHRSSTRFSTANRSHHDNRFNLKHEYYRGADKLLNPNNDKRRNSDPSSSNDKNMKKLFVKITKGADEIEIRQLFESCGHITDFFMPKKNGERIRILFVEFETEQEAKKAFLLDGKHVSRGLLSVEYAKTRSNEQERRQTSDEPYPTVSQYHRKNNFENNTGFRAISSRNQMSSSITEKEVKNNKKQDKIEIPGIGNPILTVDVMHKNVFAFKMTISGEESLIDHFHLLTKKVDIVGKISYRKGSDKLINTCNVPHRGLCLVKHMICSEKSMWTKWCKVIEDIEGALVLHGEKWNMYLLSPKTRFFQEEMKIYIPDEFVSDRLVGVLTKSSRAYK